MAAPFWSIRSASVGVLDFARPRARPVQGSAQGSARAPLGSFEPWRERSGYHVEALGLEQMHEDQGAWADLAARALEPNAFYEPGFALSAARHFPLRARPYFVAVWRNGPAPGRRRLMGLFPMTTPGGLPGEGLAELWLHKQAALATPLLDKTHAVETAEAFFDWMQRSTAAVGVLFPRMAKDGPVYAALSAAAREGGRRIEIVEEYRRAVLRAGGDADELWKRDGSGKELKELRRRQRRLEEKGPVEFIRYATPEEVRRAAEDFLALEASGWKGEKGAFLSHPSLTTFVRSATRLLAREGKCQVYALTLSGRPIAMGIVIESQDRALFWKIAFDESHRSQAPGVQLLYLLTRAQLSRPDIELTDSCAIANHPMIDRFWPDRMTICDMAVQLRPEREAAFVERCEKEKSRRRLKAFAKSAAARLLKRRVS